MIGLLGNDMMSESRLSLRELAKLSVVERNRILAAYVPMMVEDFEHDPELTEFSVLDCEDWDTANCFWALAERGDRARGLTLLDQLDAQKSN
jgi:hypothetical protein